MKYCERCASRNGWPFTADWRSGGCDVCGYGGMVPVDRAAWRDLTPPVSPSGDERRPTEGDAVAALFDAAVEGLVTRRQEMTAAVIAHAEAVARREAIVRLGWVENHNAYPYCPPGYAEHEALMRCELRWQTAFAQVQLLDRLLAEANTEASLRTAG